MNARVCPVVVLTRLALVSAGMKNEDEYAVRRPVKEQVESALRIQREVVLLSEGTISVRDSIESVELVEQRMFLCMDG